MPADGQVRSARDRVLLLRSLPSLRAVDEHSLTVMAERSRIRKFEKGETIMRAGEPIDHAYIVTSGRVDVERQGRVVTRIDGNGSVGLLSIMAHDPLGVDAVALSPTLTIEVPAEVILTSMHTNFSIVSNAVRLLATQVLAVRGNLPAAPGESRTLDAGTWRANDLTLVERLLLLRSTPFGKKANLDSLAELARCIREVRLPQGEVLWRPGDPSDHWFRIDYGRISCEAPDGRRVEVASGYSLGIFDSLAGVVRGYTARAETPLILHRTNLLDHMAIMETHVPLAAEMTALLARSVLE